MQGAESHRVPGTPSRPRTFSGREGVKLGGVLEEEQRELPRPQQPPNSEQNFLAPSAGSPTSRSPSLRSEGASEVGGRGRAEGRAALEKLRAGARPEGGGGGSGRGRNLDLSRGTQRGHHGECGTDGRRGPIGARRPLWLPMGGRAAGWAGPRLAGSGDPPPSSRRRCAGEGERK